MLDDNTKISLFPLSVVLFPGMVLPLHIFEDRYKAMIQECMTNDRSFGVVLTKSIKAEAPDVSQLNPDDIYPIGTTAHITAVQNLSDGRMNLMTVGQERFIIKDVYSSPEDFLIGQVDPYPIEADDEDARIIENLSQKLYPLVKRYIGHLGDASGENLSDAVLPTEPTALAYLAGAALQGPLPTKQTILSARSIKSLMATTINVLDREDQILAYMLKAYHVHQKVQTLPFVDYSLN